MSTPPRRPRWPLWLIRTSYQVGRPWMFDGKMLRELAGIPIRRMDLANSALALAEPDPLTLANLTTKSLTLWITAVSRFDCDAIGSEPVRDGHSVVLYSSPPRRRGSSSPRQCAGRPPAFARGRLWVRAFAGTTEGLSAA